MRITLALIVGLLLAQVARAEPDSFGLGTGRDGALSVVAGRSVVTGSAVPLRVAATARGSDVAVSAGTVLAAGDLVMIHHTGGLLPLPTPGDAKAVVLPTSGPGRFELARVASVDAAAGVLKLTQPLRFSYPVARTQVLRVGEFTDVNIEAGARLSVTPWDGRSGGILAMLVSGTVTNEGRIDADGAGYLGGVYQAHAGLKGCTGLDLSPAQGGSARGEGVAGTTSGNKSATGRGNLANGGGGGNCAQAGGGGGGHGGIGGNGGRSSVSDGARVEGGLGGAPLSYSMLERFVFGGGGGAGEGTGTDGTSGAQGGGGVFI
ncbi:hemagglutinin, partial [Corallococcus sp. CA031C]